ncbi:unnamed protein product, partial [marine sediment metagenome]
MWYGGSDGTKLRIGYAESANGIVWTKHAGNPVLDAGPDWDYSISDLKVFYDGYRKQYNGLYYGRPVGYEYAAIGLATSLDGKVWTKYVGNPVMTPLPNSWEDYVISPKYVLMKGDLHILFYEGQGDFDRWRIGVAYSMNLVDWWRDARNPILGPGFPGDFDAETVADPLRSG